MSGAAGVTAQVLPKKWMLGLLVWVFTLGPYAAGEGYASSVGPHVALVLLLAVLEAMRGVAARRAWPVVIAGSMALLLHLSWTLLASPCVDLTAKSLGSCTLFILVLWALALLSEAVDINVPVTGTLLLLTAVVTVSVLVHHAILLSQGRTVFERASGFFPEPSHLALALTPALVALSFSSGMRTVLALLFMGTLLLLSSSSTLIVVLLAGFVCAAVAAGYGRRTSMLFTRLVMPIVAILGLVWASPYRDEALARLSGIQAAEVGANASSVIYVMGWEHAWENLRNTQGLGLGFNRMGCEPRPVTDMTEITELMNLGDANYNDGSFTISKLLSELGYFGAGIWAVVFLAFLRQIGRAAKGVAPQHRVLMVLLVGMASVLLIGGFVRGTGYFSGPFLAGVFALFLLRRLLSEAAPPEDGLVLSAGSVTTVVLEQREVQP